MSDPGRPSTLDLLREALFEGGWTVERRGPGGEVVLRTVLQLDGDVVTLVERGSQLEGDVLRQHWEEVASRPAALAGSRISWPGKRGAWAGAC